MSESLNEPAPVVVSEQFTTIGVQAAEPALARKSERLASLDVFRGITMAGMILVNNAGGSPKFGPLDHAHWNGWTPTDLVFPSFLFIVGVALTFSFDKRIASGFSRLRLFEQVCRRTLILFFLGLILAIGGLPNWRVIGPYILGIVGLVFLFADEPPLGWPATAFARVRKTLAYAVLLGAIVYFVADYPRFVESNLRIPGVLQRIAICYFFASLIVLYTGVRGRVLWTAALVLGYWAIMRYVHAPTGYNPALAAARPEGLLNDWFDSRVFLPTHVYTEHPDPEGLLSTIPAIATALLGVLAGSWLKGTREKSDKVIGLFLAANVALFFGLWMNIDFPINKKIWTSSYVLFAGGIALNALAICYWLVDVKGYRRWARPFMVFGTNAIAVYVASGVFARLMLLWKLPTLDGRTIAPGTSFGETLRTWAHQTIVPTWVPWAATGKTIALRAWLYQNWFVSWAPPKLDSLLFALAYVLLWLIVMTPLYRKRVFIKV
jgi:predicted acyltransferase